MRTPFRLSASLAMLPLLLLADVGRAQGSLSGGASCYQGEYFRGEGLYTTTISSTGLGGWSSSCTAAGGRASLTASATNGILKITGSASMDGGALGLMSARGTVTWSDQLKVISGTATTVRFHFAASGLIEQSAWKSTATTVTNTVAVAGLSTYYWNPSVAFGDYGAANGVRPLTADIDEAVYGTTFMDVSLAYGMYAGFSYSVSVDAYLYAAYRQFVTGAFTSYGGSVLTDFGNTAGLIGVSFFDGTGKAVDDVAYEFQNGTTFYDPDAAVPVSEPDTLMWPAAALALLYGAARRRQRMT